MDVARRPVRGESDALSDVRLRRSPGRNETEPREPGGGRLNRGSEGETESPTTISMNLGRTACEPSADLMRPFC